MDHFFAHSCNQGKADDQMKPYHCRLESSQLFVGQPEARLKKTTCN